MKRGKGGFCMFLLVLAAFLILNCASIVYGYEKEVYLENQANIHSDGTCGRSEHGWMDDCNTNVFSGSGPGGCRSSGVSGGIGGCYFWQPTKNPKVVAESQTKLPQNNWNPGKLTVWTAHYGGGTYQNEEVNVYVNGKKVGRTDDNWCNLGHDCFSEEECDECRSDGPYQKLFTNVTFKKGWNRIRFEAVNNGGSVYVYKYKIEASPVTTGCIPGQNETQACGNCGTQSRTCLANGTWGNWGTCTGQGVCSPGSLEGQACGTGLPGICSAGTQSRTCNGVCQWGNFSSCQQTNNATTEICNLLDDDCDGQTDEVCFTCMSNTIPYSMTTGQTQSVSVTVRNDGSVPWTRNDFYRLGSQNPQDNLVWGLGRAYIAPSVVVNQSQQYTFNFNITAPSSTGIYHNEWRMVKDFAFWFLPPNCGHDVNVVNETQECIPVQNENQTCGVTDIGLCELGLQSRTCTDNGTWTDWGECIGVVLPSTEICNLLDDDCDGYIDEGNVCNVCNLDGISIRGTGGDINYIDEYNNITNEDVEFSAWLRKDSLGNYSGILSLTARGEVNGEDIQIRAKGKVREVWENDCSVLNVDNSYWSLATYKEPGKAPIQVTYDSIVYNWDKENGLLDIYGLGPDLDFNITGIMVTE